MIQVNNSFAKHMLDLFKVSSRDTNTILLFLYFLCSLWANHKNYFNIFSKLKLWKQQNLEKKNFKNCFHAKILETTLNRKFPSLNLTDALGSVLGPNLFTRLPLKYGSNYIKVQWLILWDCLLVVAQSWSWSSQVTDKKIYNQDSKFFRILNVVSTGF